MSKQKKYIEKTIKHYPIIQKVLIRYSLYSSWNPFKYLDLNVQRMDREMLEGSTCALEEISIKKEGCESKTTFCVYFLSDNNTKILKDVLVEDEPCVFSDHMTESGRLKGDLPFEVSGIMVVVQNRHYKIDVIDAWRWTDYAREGGSLDVVFFLPPKEGYFASNSEPIESNLQKKLCRILKNAHPMFGIVDDNNELSMFVSA